MELNEVEHSGSDRSMEPAWDLLRVSGFSAFDRVRLEFEKLHYLAYLFDSADECLNVVRGLHDDSAKIGDILKDAKILHNWSTDCEPLFRVNRRLDHLSCKRYRLQEPLKILASEAYSEILGMDVVLQSRVSKSTHRYLVANPGASKTELETSAREYWLSVLVTFLEESDMPICKIAAGTTDPGAVFRRSFGSRRMKTVDLAVEEFHLRDDEQLVTPATFASRNSLKVFYVFAGHRRRADIREHLESLVEQFIIH